jgi:hypothetical protein
MTTSTAQRLAVTQPTASWLLANTSHLRAVIGAISELAQTTALTRTVLAVGSLRAAMTADVRLLALWNTDYLLNSGEESWAVIQLKAPYGALDAPDVLEEVIERELFVANQRLQGLLVDTAFISRHFDGNVHTCIAGRGADARQYRIGWSEVAVQTGTSQSKAIAILGPTRESDEFHAAIRNAVNTLSTLVLGANALLSHVAGRPVLETALFSELIDRFRPATASRSESVVPVVPPSLSPASPALKAKGSHEWTYEQWMMPESPLTNAQKAIVESRLIDMQPVRIIGAAGSGKTLIMMLLALRRLTEAEQAGTPLRISYMVHNEAMKNAAFMRFMTLGAERFLRGTDRILTLTTLLGYSRQVLGLDETPVIHSDAYESKRFQREFVEESFAEVLERRKSDAAEGPILCQVEASDELRFVIVDLVADEISTAIKGQGLSKDRRRYVESERRLSRLHGTLTRTERDIVFEVFEAYHNKVFEELEVLDCDDIAVSLLSRLRTPIWDMKRRKQGSDFVFVDEAHLFNENERRLFPLMTCGTAGHVAAVLAMDEAQQTRALSMPGFGLLGFDSLANETLKSIHRSALPIVKLAFFVIQHTTDLFGPDFPDFTNATTAAAPAENDLAERPRVVVAGRESRFEKFVLKQVRALRKLNIRQIGVVCHAERYWKGLLAELGGSQLPFIQLEQRGERIQANGPIVALSRPEAVGGQEFDAVVCVGLEQGLVPPRVEGNAALASAVEQQALREMYLAFTRARYQVVVAIPPNSAPTQVLQEASRSGLLDWQHNG